MFQKIQKKIREFIKEKGQGTVEYALIIGFVAIIAVYMLTGSGLQTSTKKNITNISDVLYANPLLSGKIIRHDCAA